MSWISSLFMFSLGVASVQKIPRAWIPLAVQAKLDFELDLANSTADFWGACIWVSVSVR